MDANALLATLQKHMHAVKEDDLHLLRTRPSLAEAVTSLAARADARERDLHVADAKVVNLRQALAELTKRLSALTDDLVSTRASLSAAQETRERETKTHEETVQGLRSLCALWQQRWADERTLREEAETESKVATPALALFRPLNAHAQRRAATDVEHGIDHDYASDSDEVSNETDLTLYHTQTRRADPKSVIVHLASELDQLRRTSQAAIEQRDIEIATLQAEQTARRIETRAMYASLDRILPLATSSFSSAAPNSTAVQHKAEAAPPLPPKVESVSILDRADVVALARRSKRGNRARRLESEIRAMEAKIQLLESRTQGESVKHDRDEVEAQVAEAAAEVAPDPAPPGRNDEGNDKDDLEERSVRLEAEIARLKDELRIANESALPSADQSIAMQERDELSALLHSASKQNVELSSALEERDREVDRMAERVRSKMSDLRARLAYANERIRILEEGVVDNRTGEDSADQARTAARRADGDIDVD